MRPLVAALTLVLAGCGSTSSLRATSVLSRPGPLPVTAEFEVESSRQLMLVSASAWTEAEGVPIEVQVVVDGGVVGRCRTFANAAAMHLTLVCPAIPLSLAPGSHIVELRLGNADTVVDGADVFEVTLVEP